MELKDIIHAIKYNCTPDEWKEIIVEFLLTLFNY